MSICICIIWANTHVGILHQPYTYEYLNASFQRNKDPPVSYEGQYSTDVLAGKAYDFLDEAAQSDRPFFLTIAPNAPHSNVKFSHALYNGSFTEDQIILSPPIPAERHKDLFQDAIVPRTANFNPEQVTILQYVTLKPSTKEALGQRRIVDRKATTPESD